MNKQLVSVILPFYNAESTLLRAIQSIREQTFHEFECILIDNNSNDKSHEIVSEICTQDKRFRLINEPRQGVVFAHNAGMKTSIGKYIARMDADDWMFPDRLEQQYNFLENHLEIDVVAGLAEYIPHQKDTKGFQRYVNWSNSILEQEEIMQKQFIESPIINPTVMWRKEVSEKNGSYAHGDFPEDYELWLRWLAQGVKFRKLPVPVIKWCDSALRLTRTDDRYSDHAFFRIKTNYLSKWLSENNPHHPMVTVWGASKISRRRAKILEENGIHIQQYIDISNKRQLNRKVIYYQDIPDPGKIFILVYLKEESMRSNTVQYLKERRYAEGKDFLLVS